MKKGISYFLFFTALSLGSCTPTEESSSDASGGNDDSSITSSSEEHTHTLTYVEEKDATCTEDGNIAYYVCSTCGEYFSDSEAEHQIDASSVVIDALDHDWGEWETTTSPTCTQEGEEERICSRCGEKEADTVDALGHSLAYIASVDPSCTEEGNIAYYYCTVCNEYFSDEKGENEIDPSSVVIPALGHVYQVSWSWEGYSSATAAFTCSRDDDTQAEEATITSETTTEATCEEDGLITYTATVTFNDQTYTDIKEETVQATGHDYGEPNWAWNGYESAYATFVCKNDSSHVEKVDATITSEETITPTCTETGLTTYTAKVTFLDKEYSDTKEEEVEATGHIWKDNVCIICGYDAGGSKGLDWTYNGDSYSVIGIGSVSGSVTIPSTYNGLPVTSIGARAFQDCNNLTSITIPDSVTSIGSFAFEGCVSLSSLEIPESVTSIGSYAFYGDSNTSFDIKGTITKLGSYAFYGCGGLTTITLGEGLDAIWYYTFRSAGLTSLVIPEGVTGIAEQAFYGCNAMTSITIPSSVTYIGINAFNDCTKLTRVNISDLAAWCCIEYANQTSNPLYGSNARSTCNIYLNNSKLIALTIPDEVTAINDYAFIYARGLTSLAIPDSVTSIGNSAFYYCENLTSVSIASTVTSMGKSAFSHCNKANFSITGEITSLGDYTFASCSLLEEISLGEGLESIGNYAFQSCSALAEINIPDTVTSIGNYAFQNCTSLTSVVIPDNVTTLGTYVFYGCTALVDVTLGSSLTSIGNQSFYQCTALTSITIPAKVTYIGSKTFYLCSNLESITFENAEGWYYKTSTTATSTTSADLSDPSYNVTLFTANATRYWYCDLD